MAKDSLTYTDLRERLARGEFQPVYLLYGEEEFLNDEGAQAIIDAALPGGGHEFNLDVVSGNEADARDIVSCALSFPMMTDRRVVLVREADRLTAKDLELLGTYCEKPSPTTCLILVAAKPDLRKNPFAAIKRRGLAIESRPLYENQLPSWIVNRVRHQKREITPEACRLIIAYIGSSLREIQNELEKLAIYLGEKKEITADDVAAVVGMSREFSVFELERAIGERDIRRSTDILHHMIDAGESPPFIIVMLTVYFMQLWKAHEGRRGETAPGGRSWEQGGQGRRMQAIASGADRISRAEVERAFLLLTDADEQLKSTMNDPGQVIHRMIVRLLATEESSFSEA